LQVLLNGGKTFFQGTANNRLSKPDVRLTLTSGEVLTSVFGTADGIVSSLGFQSNLGNVYGPWGAPYGQTFEYAAGNNVNGFFGVNKNGSLAGLGVYMTSV
jgi:Jacalin-like lectin domain